VHPPEGGDERDEDDHAGTNEVGGQHRAPPVPAVGDAGGQWCGGDGGQQPEEQHTTDRGRRTGELEHQRHERDGDHPVAEPRHRLAREQSPELRLLEQRPHGSVVNECTVRSVPSTGRAKRRSAYEEVPPGERPTAEKCPPHERMAPQPATHVRHRRVPATAAAGQELERDDAEQDDREHGDTGGEGHARAGSMSRWPINSQPKNASAWTGRSCDASATSDDTAGYAVRGDESSSCASHPMRSAASAPQRRMAPRCMLAVRVRSRRGSARSWRRHDRTASTAPSAMGTATVASVAKGSGEWPVATQLYARNASTMTAVRRRGRAS